MGWYDAFKGHPERVNTLAITSNDGSAAKHFGDAFKEIGVSIQDADTQRAKENLLNSQAAYQTKKDEQLTHSMQQATQQEEQKKIDDAFKKDFNFNSGDTDYQKSLLEFEKPDDTFDSDVSNSALEYANKKIADDEKVAQTKFNDEAVEQSVTGGYKDIAAFTKANPTLVQNADGATMVQIDKYFRDKDTSLAALKSKEKDIKQATEVNKLQAKIAKVNAAQNKHKPSDEIKLGTSSLNYASKLVGVKMLPVMGSDGKPVVAADGSPIMMPDPDNKNTPQVNFLASSITDAVKSGKSITEATKEAQSAWDEQYKAQQKEAAHQTEVKTASTLVKDLMNN